jgi:hypothetical protein
VIVLLALSVYLLPPGAATRWGVPDGATFAGIVTAGEFRRVEDCEMELFRLRALAPPELWSAPVGITPSCEVVKPPVDA